jgi:hypothetical protein
MKLERGQFVETDWYVTQEGNKKAKDVIFKDFCDYIIVVKTLANNVESIEKSEDLLETKINHINSNTGESTTKLYVELDPPFIEILQNLNFPIVHD